MRNMMLAGVAVLVGVAAYWATGGFAPPSATSSTEPGGPMVAVTVPQLGETAAIGKRVFDARCAQCHGDNAAGRDGMGPPLIHKIYEPSHHGDGAFLLAAQNGVPAHHWPFGNMPPVEGITPAEVQTIVAYVREVQRANGIN